MLDQTPVPPPLIILTSDDGIDSPGLWAAAAALDSLGELLIVAPLEQQTGMGRSMPHANDGRVVRRTVNLNGRRLPAYGVQASPAQAILHAVFQLAPRQAVLAVAGINYGENVGISLTISGTVGAALEAASCGIPALAVSLQTDLEHHMELGDAVDFSGAAYFTRFFAERMLAMGLPQDLDVLKIEVPRNATQQTAWRVTRLERRPYYIPVVPPNGLAGGENRLGYTMVNPDALVGRDTDAAVIAEGTVAVTPLSLDMTSRLDLAALEQSLRR